MGSDRKFYVYGFLREDGTPYYIGKGCGKRMYTRYGRTIHPPTDKSRIVKFKDGLTEEESFKLEMELIGVTPNLRNLTEGGEGPSGYKHTEESKKKVSEGTIKSWTDERKKSYSKKMKGNQNRKGTGKFTPEEMKQRTKEKHRERMRKYRMEGKFTGRKVL